MKKIFLKRVDLEDKEFLRKIRNDNREYFLYQKYITKSLHSKWFSKELKKPYTILFIICLKDLEMARIGTIDLVDFDIRGHEGILGRFIIVEDFRHKGLGHQALEKFANFCRVMKIRKLSLELRKDNKAAFNFYTRERFKKILEDKNKITMRVTL
jgi:ribosomal protein S18 acetylase RimI-like enzyme